MANISTIKELTELGRHRLSEHFFMRDMLYSEVGNYSGIPNIPVAPELALAAGEKLCQLVLEPLRAAFGHIAIRSAYRSPRLNAHCHQLHKLGVAESWCTCNDDNAARHIWDVRDASGYLGAVATIIVPAYINHYERSGDWQSLGWWIRDNLEHYAEAQFFRRLCAFNIRWFEGPSNKSIGYLDPPTRIILTKTGEPGFEGDHRPFYSHVIGKLLQSGVGCAP